MSYTLQIDHWKGRTSTSLYFYNVEYPKICPRCLHAIGPVKRYVYVHSNQLASIVFECNSCGELFFVDYETIVTSSTKQLTFRNIKKTYPNHFKEELFDLAIQKISPSFVNIYNQSLQAELLDLDQISGVGYRKSLEFLVKDYAIFLNSQDEVSVNKIKNMSLVQCIENYITHPRIKPITKRAAWLGNDETHYVRKYTSEDIDTLKSLIKLSCNWITMDIDSQELESRIIHPSQLEN